MNAFRICVFPVLAMVMTVSTYTCADDSGVSEQEIFISGKDGYHTFRIPSIIVTKEGTSLAFCEGRKNGRGDAGDIDLVLRRSTDGGVTWSPLITVWDDEDNTCGNPCPVVDQSTGVIWMPMTWNAGKVSERKTQAGYGKDSRRVFLTKSSDDGVNWSKPIEITQSTKKMDWSWYATGPGAGIQIEQGPHRGRMVIPCDHKSLVEGEKELWSHVIYSDDHGKTWKLGGSSPADGVNECEVVELAGGGLMLNMRSYDKSVASRQICFSNDGGDTFSDQRHDETLIEPVCQASIRRYRWPSSEATGILLFSNPASTTAREKMTIRASYDDGETWPVEKELYKGSSAYSCLTVLPDGQIGCLYEKDNYSVITLAKFPIAWLEQKRTP